MRMRMRHVSHTSAEMQVAMKWVSKLCIEDTTSRWGEQAAEKREPWTVAVIPAQWLCGADCSGDTSAVALWCRLWR